MNTDAVTREELHQRKVDLPSSVAVTPCTRWRDTWWTPRPIPFVACWLRRRLRPASPFMTSRFVLYSIQIFWFTRRML